MDMRVKNFIDLNKENITSVYNYECSAGVSVVYIFLKTPDCKGIELLADANDCVEAHPYMSIDGMEQDFRERVGAYVEV